MQKLALFAGAVVMAMGVTAASSSAFAMGCLNNQVAVTPSLSSSLSSYTGGTGSSGSNEFDAANQYNAQLASGNACSTTQQSLPTDQQQHRGHQNTAY